MRTQRPPMGTPQSGHQEGGTRRRLVRWLAFAGALALATPPLGAGSAQPLMFDIYDAGVAVAELTVGPEHLSIRKKNVARNTWGPPTSRPTAEAAVAEAFELSGSIRRLPADLASLANIDWWSLEAVGWPDADTIYVRHRELVGNVNGRPRDGIYWAERDASQPLDLVFDRDSSLIAGIDVTRDRVMVRRGFEAFTTVGRWRDAGVSQPLYGFRALDRAAVEMSDGTKLTTLVYLPTEASGPFPTIFVRSPYGIGNLINQYWYHVVRGYALVFQSTRGTSFLDPANRSEGSWEEMVREPGDGGEALAWIVGQPWSDGSVCMQGGSYVGYTQWSATIADNPALKCIVPEVSMGTAFADQPFMGETYVTGSAYYMFWMLQQELLPERRWSEILRHRPLIELDNYAIGHNVPEWDTVLSHWRNDAYWKQQDWHDRELKRDFASLQISGWFDDDFPGTRSNWALMQRLGRQPQRLIIGPWRHGYNNDRQLNGYSFGPDAIRDDIRLLKQQWYDRFLGGNDNAATEAVVEYFVLGENRWRRSSAWPPEGVSPQRWYLHSGGLANSSFADGSLSLEPPAAAQAPERYLYDPDDPVPNWYNFDLMESWADVQSYPYDFKDIEARQDVVVYTSPPLEEDLTIAGNIMLELYASTDVRDTDWWVHISDVDENLQSHRLTVGVLRARFRHLDDPEYHVFGSNFEREELLSGSLEDVVHYRVSAPAIANTFKAGHRVRVAVMNALDNYSFPNSNTGGDEALATDTITGTMVVHHTPEHPSHIVLPVMPR